MNKINFYQIHLIKVNLVLSNHIHVDNESEKTVSIHLKVYVCLIFNQDDVYILKSVPFVLQNVHSCPAGWSASVNVFLQRKILVRNGLKLRKREKC